MIFTPNSVTIVWHNLTRGRSSKRAVGQSAAAEVTIRHRCAQIDADGIDDVESSFAWLFCDRKFNQIGVQMSVFVLATKPEKIEGQRTTMAGIK